MRQIITFFIIFLSGFAYAQTFVNMNAGLPALKNSIATFGDSNADGYVDLYLSGTLADDNLAGGLYTFDGSSYTLSTTSGLPLVSLGAARWGDIDNDGDLDILILGYDDVSGNGFTDLYINNNDGTFSASNAGFPPTYMGDIAFSDVNNDGFIDIAITGMESVSYTNITKIYKNNGNATFTEFPGVSLPGMNFGRIKFADYNNDGFEDIALNGLDDGSNYYTHILSNNGDETFSESGIALTQLWLGDLEWGDYNGDGNVDLVISGTGGASGMERKTNIYKNNADGTFTDINANLMGVSHSSLEWEDFDGDGDLDILVIGAFTTPGDGNYTYAIYNNMGSDVFQVSTSAVLKGSYYGDADCIDITDDTKPDIVITGYDEFDNPASNIFVNTTSGIGVNDYASTNTFYLFPNPYTQGSLSVGFNQKSAFKWISIYTITGKKVYNSSIYNKQNIDLSNLSKGVYIVKLSNVRQSVSKKLIIQ